jgi:hypothetical protein
MNILLHISSRFISRHEPIHELVCNSSTLTDKDSLSQGVSGFALPLIKLGAISALQ